MLDVLPADICCKVGEYFGCWRCEDMKERNKNTVRSILTVLRHIQNQKYNFIFLGITKKKHFYQKHQLGVMVAKNFKMKLTEYLINQR